MENEHAHDRDAFRCQDLQMDGDSVSWRKGGNAFGAAHWIDPDDSRKTVCGYRIPEGRKGYEVDDGLDAEKFCTFCADKARQQGYEF